MLTPPPDAEEKYLYDERIAILIEDSQDPILINQATEIAEREIQERREGKKNYETHEG